MPGHSPASSAPRPCAPQQPSPQGSPSPQQEKSPNPARPLSPAPGTPGPALSRAPYPRAPHHGTLSVRPSRWPHGSPHIPPAPLRDPSPHLTPTPLLPVTPPGPPAPSWPPHSRPTPAPLHSSPRPARPPQAPSVADPLPARSSGALPAPGSAAPTRSARLTLRPTVPARRAARCHAGPGPGTRSRCRSGLPWDTELGRGGGVAGRGEERRGEERRGEERRGEERRGEERRGEERRGPGRAQQHGAAGAVGEAAPRCLPGGVVFAPCRLAAGTPPWTTEPGGPRVGARREERAGRQRGVCWDGKSSGAGRRGGARRGGARTTHPSGPRAAGGAAPARASPAGRGPRWAAGRGGGGPPLPFGGGRSGSSPLPLSSRLRFPPHGASPQPAPSSARCGGSSSPARRPPPGGRGAGVPPRSCGDPGGARLGAGELTKQDTTFYQALAWLPAPAVFVESRFF